MALSSIYSNWTTRNADVVPSVFTKQEEVELAKTKRETSQGHKINI